MISSLEEKARKFATRWHYGQLRKYTDEPYITHCEAVAGIVRSVKHVPEMVAAAWLHDTVEDTACTLSDIEAVFGESVARLVSEVTKVSSHWNGNRAHRVAMDNAHYRKASPQGQTIKLADLIHNTASIVDYDPKFAKTYMKEKAELVPFLTEGDPALRARAQAQLDKYFGVARPEQDIYATAFRKSGLPWFSFGVVP